MVAFAQNSRILIAIVSRITNFTEQYPNHHHRDFYYHKRWPFSLCCFCFVGWFPVCLVCCWTFLHKILIIIYWVSLWGIHMNWWSKEESKKKREQQNTRPTKKTPKPKGNSLFCSFICAVLHLKRYRCIFMIIIDVLVSLSLHRPRRQIKGNWRATHTANTSTESNTQIFNKT